jgi:ABC-2 type transport system permease protein
MTDLALITISGIRNNLRSRTVLIVTVTITLMCAVGVAVPLSILVIKPAVDLPAPNRSELEMYLSLIMAVMCFIGLGVNLDSFAFQIITREKSRGVIQSLLATPLNARNIWLGKSLAIFFPGFIMAVVCSLMALLAINFIYFVPRIGFLMNPWIALSTFIAIPLVFLSLCLLVHLIGLTAKAATGNAIAQVFLPVIITLIINLVLRSVLDAASWVFTLVNLGIAAVIGIIIILLLPRLTRERIVLSE